MRANGDGELTPVAYAAHTAKPVVAPTVAIVTDGPSYSGLASGLAEQGFNARLYPAIKGEAAGMRLGALAVHLVQMENRPDLAFVDVALGYRQIFLGTLGGSGMPLVLVDNELRMPEQTGLTQLQPRKWIRSSTLRPIIWQLIKAARKARF